MGELRQVQLLRVAAAASFFLAIINHLLPPKSFAATQLLFDYEFGFTRRGLFGSLLNFVVGPSVSMQEIYLTCAIITLAATLGFYFFLLRELSGSLSGLLLLILALNSFAFSSFTGNTGYLDGVLLTLVLIALLSDARSNTGLVVRIAVCFVGVLIHENMLPYFALLFGLEILLARDADKSAIRAAVLPPIAGIGTVVVLVLFGEMPADMIAGYVSHIEGKANFAFDPNSTDVAGRTLLENFALMQDMRGTTKYWAWVLFDGVPLFLMALFMIWLGQRMLGDQARAIAKISLVLAVLAPQSLNLIAFDVVRFGVVSVLCGFLCVAIILRHVDGAASRLQRGFGWPVFTLLLVLNANVFTIEVNAGSGHTSQFPWVLVQQLEWMMP